MWAAFIAVGFRLCLPLNLFSQFAAHGLVCTNKHLCGFHSKAVQKPQNSTTKPLNMSNVFIFSVLGTGSVPGLCRGAAVLCLLGGTGRRSEEGRGGTGSAPCSKRLTSNPWSLLNRLQPHQKPCAKGRFSCGQIEYPED